MKRLICLILLASGCASQQEGVETIQSSRVPEPPTASRCASQTLHGTVIVRKPHGPGAYWYFVGISDPDKESVGWGYSVYSTQRRQIGQFVKLELLDKNAACQFTFKEPTIPKTLAHRYWIDYLKHRRLETE